MQLYISRKVGPIYSIHNNSKSEFKTLNRKCYSVCISPEIAITAKPTYKGEITVTGAVINR